MAKTEGVSEEVQTDTRLRMHDKRQLGREDARYGF